MVMTWLTQAAGPKAFRDAAVTVCPARPAKVVIDEYNPALSVYYMGLIEMIRQGRTDVGRRPAAQKW
jgi:hypothetical protein